MAESTADMMLARRTALDGMADRPLRPIGAGLFADIWVDLADHDPVSASDELPASLVAAVTDRLVRDESSGGPGVAVVTGVSEQLPSLPVMRMFHEVLFRRVWGRFRSRCPEILGECFKTKVGVISDGAIPLDLYGSSWTFKSLHMDRDALLFSHLYGPTSGFSGGTLLVADVREYMSRHRLRFDDLFEWSDEATPGSKPVLRPEHVAVVLAQCGAEISDLGPDQIVFVNNTPGAGILHGVTPVEVIDQATFVRAYHRCSVKELPRC